jgi:hypothetical protein
MASVASPLSPVNSDMQDVTAVLKRGIGIRQAMQAFADLDRNRHGLSSEPLRLLPRDDQAAYRQIVERVIDAFEQGAYDKAPADRPAQQAAERDAYLLMERQRARLTAAERGHELGGWWTVAGRSDETASCTRCLRVAVLVVTYNPLLEITRAGSALTEGCLVVAETEVR